MTTDQPNGVTRIPVEWCDPRHVIPHLAGELSTWLTSLRAIAADLEVVQGSLDPSARPRTAAEYEAERQRLQESLTAIQGRLVGVNHQLAGRVQAYRLIAAYVQSVNDSPAPPPRGVRPPEEAGQASSVPADTVGAARGRR